MIVAIADTHAALWYLFSDPRLGRSASAFIDAAVASGDHIGLSAISIEEMVYLTERGRIPSTALNDIRGAVADPKAVLRYVSLDETIAMNMSAIARDEIPDLPERIIAATAHLYGIPVLTRDGRIRSSNIRAIR